MRKDIDIMEFLSQLKNSLELLDEFRKAIVESEIVLEEILSGIHKSKSGGLDVEFLDYRGYVYGDDLRFVDWKVFLKSERFFIKRFEDNKRNSVFLFVDTSASMFHNGKFVKALLIMVAIANIFLRLKDDVYLIFQNEKVKVGEYGEGYLIQTVNDIYNTSKEARGDFLIQYTQLLDIIPRNSIICLFSDLFSDPDSVVNSVNTISATGNFQYIFHILCDDELNPTKKGLRLLTDPDSDSKLIIQCDNIWEEYKAELNNYINKLKEILTFSEKGKYILCPENMSLRDILFSFFETTK
ncbi:MAG: DUF58 domain-containing protein [Deltaproteobacteria bacterium]|nr:DUF58 domain-containing protein [Deltaproteobacteria bacterium]